MSEMSGTQTHCIDHVTMAMVWHRFGRFKPGSAIGVGQSVTLHAGAGHVTYYIIAITYVIIIKPGACQNGILHKQCNSKEI